MTVRFHSAVFASRRRKSLLRFSGRGNVAERDQAVQARGAFHHAPSVPALFLSSVVFFILASLFPATAAGQVFVVGAKSATGVMPAFQPTQVELGKMPLTEQTRLQLVRILHSEQAFAARPLPMGGKGVTLHANGDLTPDAKDYQKALYEKGISAGAGDRIVITNIAFHHDRIQIDLNGGPDLKHKYLRHISVGMDPCYTTPIVQDDGLLPTGARITLAFKGYIPEMTGAQVKALLQPVIDFNLKSPVRAYTDTLPPTIREAILAHTLLVGMTHRMVLASMGQPDSKIREKMDGVQYEEWIFGQPPQDVDFVRYDGDRVVRIEVARQGKALVVRVQDETGGYTPPVLERQIALGDPSPGADQSQSKPPTLMKTGEGGAAPSDEQPVQFPKQKLAESVGGQ